MTINGLIYDAPRRVAGKLSRLLKILINPKKLRKFTTLMLGRLQIGGVRVGGQYT